MNIGEIRQKIVGHIESVGSMTDHKMNMIDRYVKFVVNFSSENREYPSGTRFEKHHILPKSLFPEYSELKIYKWNKVMFPTRAHIVAHAMLHYIFGGKMTAAITYMNRGNKYKGSMTRYYAKIRDEYYESEEFLEGCRRGGVNNSTNVGRVRYTNGVKEISILLEDEVPDGFIKGCLASHYYTTNEWFDKVNDSLDETKCIRCTSVKLDVEYERIVRHIRDNKIPFKRVHCAHIDVTSEQVELAMVKHNYHKVNAAKELGISHVIMGRLVREYDIKSPMTRFRDDREYFDSLSDRPLYELYDILSTNKNGVNVAFEKYGVKPNYGYSKEYIDGLLETTSVLGILRMLNMKRSYFDDMIKSF